MVELRETRPGWFEVSMFSRPPTIYLDHWALRRISARSEWRNRFIDAFQTCGTLFFSVVHLAELARNSGESVGEIRSFLQAVGPNWMVIRSDPNVVMELEAHWLPGMKAPHVGDLFFKQTDFLKRLTTGPVSLAHLIDMLDLPGQREVIVAEVDGMCDQMVMTINKWRDAYRQTPAVLDVPFPEEPFRERFATRYAYFQLMRLFVRDAFTVGLNDVRDFFHTVVPVAHANIVVLDKRWHAQVEKLKLPPRFMRCFKERTMNDFFDVLEACSAAQN